MLISSKITWPSGLASSGAGSIPMSISLVLASPRKNALADLLIFSRTAGGALAGARSLGHHRNTNLARTAGPVVHHKGLAKVDLQLLADLPRNHVHTATRWQGHDDLDGVFRVCALGEGGGRKCQAGSGAECEAEGASGEVHGSLSG